MQPLHKRLLLTLFPDEMKQADINPATMFISSLSTKEFFSLLSRKVTEYYKTNGYDTGIETFEAKIGLGNEQGITVNKANDYYGYLIAAQYSGKGFFSPTFVTTHVTLYSITRLIPFFQKEDKEALIHTMVMLYLMPLLFVTHIKRFPTHLDTKSQFNRFVQLCESTLGFVMEKEDGLTTKKIIYILNNESSVLRNMVSICRHSSEVFPLQDDTIDSYWQRMLDGHLFDTGSDDINNFLTEYETQSTTTSYTDHEESVMNMLFPNDFSIRSLYDQVCIFDTIHHIINPRYKSSPSLTEARKNLSDDDSQWPIILSAFGDITYAKNDFWKGVQQFIMHHRANQAININEDIDEFMSSIEDQRDIDIDTVPESIKAESRVVDQIVHFYIGMIGGHRSAKNDNFRYRRTTSLPPLPVGRSALESTDHTYRGEHFSLYDTNGFYYQRAWEHIRQGKQRFHIPLRASLGFRTNDIYTKQQIVISSLMHLIGDTHLPRMKLTLHQSTIVELFGREYVDRIRTWIKRDTIASDIHWRLIDDFSGGSWSSRCAHVTTTLPHREALVDSLYRLDRQLRYDLGSAIIHDSDIHDLLHSLYTDHTLAALLSELKKTLFGAYLRVRYEVEHHDSHGTALWLVYLRDVLHVDQLLRKPLQNLLQTELDRHHDILGLRIQIDDNPGFLSMCSAMRHDFLGMEKHSLTAEDTLWLHSTLHHISSYNTRYIIPE